MRDPAAYTFNASRYVPPLTGIRRWQRCSCSRCTRSGTYRPVSKRSWPLSLADIWESTSSSSSPATSSRMSISQACLSEFRRGADLPLAQIRSTLSGPYHGAGRPRRHRVLGRHRRLCPEQSAGVEIECPPLAAHAAAGLGCDAKPGLERSGRVYQRGMVRLKEIPIVAATGSKRWI
jgi:hypothetical protein